MMNPNGYGDAQGYKYADVKSTLMSKVDMSTVNKIVDTMMQKGFRKNADIIDYQKLYDKKRFGLHSMGSFMPNLSKETVNLAKTCRSIDVTNNNVDMSRRVDFEANGGFTVNNYNTIISQVITEVYDNAPETSLAQIFPFSQYPASNVVIDVFAAPGGLIAPYQYGTAVGEVPKIGNRTYEFSGIPYRGYINIDERDLTFWRDLGNPDISARGILQRLTMYSMQAKVITNNRINLIRSSIFNNGINYYNNSNPLSTVSYQIPTYNQVSSVTDPVNQWGTVNTTTNAYTVNPNANPIFDLYYYTKAYLPWITKFQQIRKCKMIMNPITEALIIQNPNVQKQIAILQTAPGTFNDARSHHNAEFVMKALIPGLECEVMVDGSSYLLQNSDVTWNPNGSGFTSTPVAQQYFIPSGSILFAIDVEDHGGRLGEFVFTTSIQNGGFIEAQAAPWYIIEDLTAPGTRGGPLNPSIQLDFGFAGGLQPYHPEGTLLGSFAVLTS